MHESSQDVTEEPPSYNVRDKLRMYELAQEDQFATAKMSGPPVLTLANHIGLENDDESGINDLHTSLEDLLMLGTPPWLGPGFFGSLLQKDFIVGDADIADQLRQIENNRVLSIHIDSRNRLTDERFFSMSDLNIRDDVSAIDISDLESRIKDLNKYTGRDFIEDDWNGMERVERERRQYRLCYNFLLYLCSFTEREESNSD